MKRIAVLTSGSDAPGMNAAIRAVVRRGIFSGLEVYGVQNGFRGLVEGHFISMDLGSVGDIIHRGGTILQNDYCENFQTVEVQKKALRQLKEVGIEGLIVIGGDGSIKCAEMLSIQGYPTVCIPGTIDNDVPGTDYTIGFDTAVNTAVEAIDKIRNTASSHDRTYVIEVMGRHAGDIALWTGIGVGAESLIIPEAEYDIEDIISRIKQGYKRGKTHSIIVVAEGVRKGIGTEMGKVIQEKTGFDTKVTILGHLQRGGAPSAYDRMISSQMGAKAVDLLMKGEKGVMVGVKNGQLIYRPLEELMEDQHVINLDIYHLARSLSI
ncbi:6-phosphofructokinase [Priestia endophytica]|jgi:6-phosphofructokinase 1|uniref:6-phosphofructokinase n=1 Tax=Priestia endophytica TaxID=135735 RepID=UPI000F52DE2B|nr:6-phosphofructokinase [Priestia endophytica]MED4069915.1 6-phosphofructokinase [Priestia endophytica]RPK15084.1 6-phosphofructokinase [Priestia endophytica]